MKQSFKNRTDFYRKPILFNNCFLNHRFQSVIKKSSFFLCIQVLWMLSFVSCVSQRKIEYLQSHNSKGGKFEIPKNVENRVIRPGDELYVQVYSFTNNITSSIGTEGGSTNITPYSATLVSYKVNKDSIIMFPLIGKISIAGLTIVEAEAKIKSLLNSYLNNPSVNIKIVSTNISVIGEVAHPGNYSYTNVPLNIYQALSLAGDITEYGDRTNVRIVRNTDKNVEVINLDLTKEEVINSKYFYLESNDVIYIRPLKRRVWGITRFPYEILISAISTTAVLLTYIQTRK